MIRETYLRDVISNPQRDTASATFHASSGSRIFITRCRFIDAWADYVPPMRHSRTRDGPQYQRRKIADGYPESIAALSVGSRATLPTITKLQHGSSATTAQGDTFHHFALSGSEQQRTLHDQPLLSTLKTERWQRSEQCR